MRRVLLCIFVVWACSCGINGHVPPWLAAKVAHGAIGARISPNDWGVKWARIYDLAASQRKDPSRIISIGCKRFQQVGYVCVAEVMNLRSPHHSLCMHLLIGDDGTVLAGKKAPCGKLRIA